MKKPDTRKHKYLVGYVGEGQCVYDFKFKSNPRQYVEPMTLAQAKRKVEELNTPSAKVAIYELVPIAVFKNPKL